MGLDAVEFAMELEDHFGLRLRDDVFSHARTVGEMAALIAAGLPMAQGACMTARSFYRLRAWFEGAGGMPARSVRPSTRLVDVLPCGSRRRAAWAAMQREVEKPLFGEPPGIGVFKVPELTWSNRARGVRRVTASAVVVVWLMGGAAMFVLLPWWVAALALVWLLPMLLVCFLWLDRRFQYELAEGVVTAGDLARRMVSDGGSSAAELRSRHDEVLEGIRQIAARQFDVPREKVTAQTRLVEDLGMG